MNKNVLIFILLSLAFGVAAVFIAQDWLDANKLGNIEAGKKATVVVTTPIPVGTIIEAKHVKVMQVSDNLVPENAFAKTAEVIGLVVKSPLFPNEVVRQERVAKKGAGSALASLIAPNMRAITIRVNDVVGVAGFILPGNRVDVLMTSTRTGAVQTEVVLENIKILAIDQRASSDENQPKIVRAVTVEVDLMQAEVLLSSRNQGSLQLALRNPNDESKNVIPEEAQPQIAEVNAEPEPETEKPKVIASVDSRRKVEVIKGVKRETVQTTN
ncbi:Flp pilus assembly protein CpaB [Thalassotalea sp. HSM 43]|uniref:Flp pilus assembly protein CpaB n=1 Tax=Thalassotalea sp. HSM 43 TaxID=2552945 RepID=UPI00108138C3|nr:Flp pilus assembly protein CpaB [Thalassotalea sp. HSM 43]QBY03441.1 Flp pilus assembly protein CpaB [Thalassotalea sp. HSM 43]